MHPRLRRLCNLARQYRLSNAMLAEICTACQMQCLLRSLPGLHQEQHCLLPLLLHLPSLLQVSRGAEDVKDSIKDAGNKLKGDSHSASNDLSKKADRTGKDIQNRAEDAADDSEGLLKKVSIHSSV